MAAGIDRLSTWVGKTVGWLTLLMVLVTCLVVAARYLFSLGSIALQESVMYMHGLVFMLGIAYTLKEGGHVRVDALYQRFSERGRAWVDLGGAVFFLAPVALFIGLGSLDYVALSWSLREASAEPGGLPAIYLLKALIPLMAATLLLQGVAEALRSILLLLGRQQDDAGGAANGGGGLLLGRQPDGAGGSAEDGTLGRRPDGAGGSADDGSRRPLERPPHA